MVSFDLSVDRSKCPYAIKGSSEEGRRCGGILHINFCNKAKDEICPWILSQKIEKLSQALAKHIAYC